MRLPPLLAAMCATLTFLVPSTALAQTFSITSLSPASATTSGGTVVLVVYPYTYPRLTSVTVDGVTLPAYDYSTGMYFVAPAHSAGQATVDIVNSAGVHATKVLNYADPAAPGLASPIARVSVSATGAEAIPLKAYNNPAVRISPGFMMGSSNGAISGDGCAIAFESDGDLGLAVGYLPPNFGYLPARGIYLKNQCTGTLTRVSAVSATPSAANLATDARISFDGTHVIFNGNAGIMAFDAGTSVSVRVDVSDLGGGGPRPANAQTARVSADGRLVAFVSMDNLAGVDSANTSDLFVRDLVSNHTERWTTDANVFGADISGDGRYLVFYSSVRLDPAADTNSFNDVYLIDRQAAQASLPFLRLLSLGANAQSSSPSISADGKTVVFSTSATNLGGAAGIMTLNLLTGVFTRIGTVYPRAISASGQRFAFSNGTVLDRSSGTVVQVGTAADGAVAASPVQGVYLAGDGRTLVFHSLATNLVADDTNVMTDVFAKALPPDTPAGAGVGAVPADPKTGATPVTLAFSNIAAAGDTSLTMGDIGPPLPAGFSLGSPAHFYELSTTASFTGPVTVCIDYSGVTVGDEGALQLLHYDGNAWVDITTSRDTAAHVICGETMSFSPFVIASPPAKSTPTISWSSPSAMVYGTALSGSQLNATASTEGTFIYTPAVGTMLAAAAGQTLHVKFVPADSEHYWEASADVSIDVLKATLQVSAESKIKILGAANPQFTVSMTGFVLGDTAGVLSGAPTVTTVATTGSPVGTYPIVPAVGTLSAANYRFDFKEGTLSVVYASVGPCLGEPGHAVLQPVYGDGTSVF